MYVNKLNISKVANYNAQTNAAGDTVADFINHKRTIEVGIIPLDAADMVKLQNAIKAFNVSITFLNPQTNSLEENVSCIITEDNVEYYTIQIDKVMCKALTLSFIEL